jgi:bifunctional non-homologous end joining protein LigD
MRLRLVKDAFDAPEFIFELKHDGFRALAYIEDGECRLISRNLHHLKFDALKRALAKLPVQNAILDGEVVCIDEDGVSQFNELLKRNADPVFYAFDLVWVNGKDLRQFPLIERKSKLAKLVEKSKCDSLIYAQHIAANGKKFFDTVCSQDLEGIIAKRKSSIYKSNGHAWMKIKNPAYTRAEGRHELLTKRKR